MYQQTAPVSGGTILGPYHQQPTQTKIAIKLLGPACGGKSKASEALIEKGGRHYSSSKALLAFSDKYAIPSIRKQMDSAEMVDLPYVQTVSRWDFQDFVAHRQIGIFDGWGRHPDELNMSIPFLRKAGASIHVIFLDADDEILMDRAQKRGRNDDALVKKRIQNYRTFFPLVLESLEGYQERYSKLYIHHLKTSRLTEEQVQKSVLQLTKLH